MKNIKAQVIAVLMLVFGPHYKVRVAALGFALASSTIDYCAEGGKMSIPLLSVVWFGAVKSFFVKSIDVTGIGANATTDVTKDGTVPPIPFIANP